MGQKFVFVQNLYYYAQERNTCWVRKIQERTPLSSLIIFSIYHNFNLWWGWRTQKMGDGWPWIFHLYQHIPDEQIYLTCTPLRDTQPWDGTVCSPSAGAARWTVVSPPQTGSPPPALQTSRPGPQLRRYRHPPPPGLPPRSRAQRPCLFRRRRRREELSVGRIWRPGRRFCRAARESGDGCSCLGPVKRRLLGPALCNGKVKTRR